MDPPDPAGVVRAAAALVVAAAAVALGSAPAAAGELYVLNHLDVPARTTAAPARCADGNARRIAPGAVHRLDLPTGAGRCRVRIAVAGRDPLVTRCRAVDGGHRCRSRPAVGGRPGVTWSAWPVEDRGFLTVAAERPLSGRRCGPAGQPPLPVGWAMQRWMACTFGDHPATRLVDAAIPGAHDAGASDMTLDRVRTCRSGTAATVDGLLDAGAWTMADSRAWSETQTAGVLGQLDAGTRYFDLRVDWQQLGPDAAVAERYRFCHNANWAADLAATLRDIARWASDHPREVLLLDVRFLGSLATPGDLDRTARELCPATYARTAAAPACREALAGRDGAAGEELDALRVLQLDRLRAALAPVCGRAQGPGVPVTELTFGGLWADARQFVVAFDASAADRAAFAADPALAGCLWAKPQTIAEHWPWEGMRDAVPGCDGDYAARSADAVRALTAWALEPGHGLDPAAAGDRTMLHQSQTHFTPSDATFATAGTPGCADSLRTWQRRITATMDAPDRERGCLSSMWPVAVWERWGGRPNIVETDFLDDARDPLGRPDPYLFTGTLAAISWARLHDTTPSSIGWGPWAYSDGPAGPGCDALYARPAA